MPIRGQPRYNPRRRSGLGCWLNYQSGSECAGPTSSIGGSSTSSWTNSHYHTFARLMNNGGPPSPCPSDHPFNSASSSLSESSSSHRSQEDDISIVTGKDTENQALSVCRENQKTKSAVEKTPNWKPQSWAEIKRRQGTFVMRKCLLFYRQCEFVCVWVWLERDCTNQKTPETRLITSISLAGKVS